MLSKQNKSRNKPLAAKKVLRVAVDPSPHRIEYVIPFYSRYVERNC